MAELTFTVPLPNRIARLSVNRRTAYTRHGVPYVNAQSRNWQNDIVLCWRASGLSAAHLRYPVVVELRWWFVDKLRRDASNLHKNLLDGLAMATGINDSHFLVRDLSVDVDKLQPRVQITLREQGE